MKHSKIITVTLNPSLDRTVTTHFLAQGYHNWLEGTSRLDPAGQGVSISRALHRLKYPVHAVVMLGRDPIGRAYEALLRADGFDISLIRVDGQTRSNMIILDTGHGNETQLVEENRFDTGPGLIELRETLKQLITPDDIVVFAGSLPPGLDGESVARLITLANEAGARTVIAVTFADLEPLLQAGPGLVALTQLQAEAYFNFPVRSVQDIAYCARQLRKDNEIQRVLIEMRETGFAYLIGAEGEWLVDLPDVDGGTTSGIWEAFLAGFLGGRNRQQPLDEALAMGGAAAQFAAGQVGSEFGRRKEIEPLIEEIDVSPARQAGTPDPGQ